MNNDNDLNLHSITKLSGWLRYCLKVKMKSVQANLRGGPLDILGGGVSDPKKKFMQEIELEKKFLHALEERKKNSCNFMR